MATRRPLKQISALKKTRRYRDRIRKTERKMQLERLEDRRVMATGPLLVNVLSNYGPIQDGETLSIAPREITLRFAEGQRIDPATIATGVRITRAGLDGALDTPDDVPIQPGFIGLTDTTREIVVRFAENLPEDVYRIELVGAGPDALRDQQGLPVNDGESKFYNFSLDLGAQVIAVVPQPVKRVNGVLQQELNKIEVYFNPDLMDQASVTNPAYYKLINAETGDVQLPTNVQYIVVPQTASSPGEYKAVLTFATNISSGVHKLKVGATDEQNNTLNTAVHVGSTADPTTNFYFQSLYLGDDPLRQGAAAVNDVDLYRFDLRGTVGGTVPFSATVTATGSLNPALRIFDWQGNPVGGAFFDVPGQTETITNFLLPIDADPAKNVYYLGVSSSGNINYNPLTGQNATGGTGAGKYSLAATWDASVTVENNGNDSSFDNANNAGVLGLGGITISGHLAPQYYAIDWPGVGDDPGHRDLPPEPTGEEHISGVDGVQGIQVITYNFPTIYGTTPQGNTLFNGITENQKQRAREIFEIYGRYLGVKFIETPASGGAEIRVVTGDLRAIDPTIPTGPGGVAGLAGNGLAIMDNAEAWGNSEYGGAWFTVAMHEIGHLLGLGHSYDLPGLTIQGSAETPDTTPGNTAGAEPVFPGDYDITHGQALYRPEGRDIDLYKFQLTERGRFTAETIAERLSDRPGVNSSLADTVLTLYREVDGVRQEIARNDDYYSSDSFLELDLEPGIYYIGVTSKGMTGVDPNVPDSGFGGLTDGAYELKLNFVPATTGGMVDTEGTLLDGDLDGVAGGAYEFFFKAGQTIFVDKAKDPSKATGPIGSITNPYTTIEAALDAAEAASVNNRPIVRIVGNGGTDGNLATAADNRPYLVGYDDLGEPLADGFDFQVPQNVTVMIDGGAIIKFQAANIDVGTSTQGLSRAGGAIQVLGTPMHNVYLTSFSNDLIGGDTDGPTLPAAPGDWGGIVIRDDSDLEQRNIFLNYINHANITYGGGKVVVNASEEVFNPIHIVTARPTITFNTIQFSADAAISANPDSFQDTLSTAANISVAGAASRIGPDIYGNTVVLNSFNGLFVRVRTEFGSPVEVLNTFARFDDTDIVHMITENLHINGTPGGPEQIGGRVVARYDARLRIDPGVIVKLDGTRIEARVGSQLIIEGTDELPVILTSLVDDRYGAGGTFDTSNDGSGSAPVAGDWGGLVFNANSMGSIDRARIFFAGGQTAIEGSFATFNPVEIHQADVRIARSVFQFNADGTGLGGNRNGRGSNAAATIFVRGAQPIIVDNIIRGNRGNIISINANAMTSNVVADYGRSTGLALAYNTLGDNYGPLVRLNRIVNNGTNGMEVRGGVLTTESVWDDTDIAHVLRDQITILNHHVFSGLRLQSSTKESLVVKLLGANAGFLASGVPMEITDRIGGSLYIVGQPNRPVVLTSLHDDTVPAGLQPNGMPLYDTNNNGNATSPSPGDWNSVRLDQYSNDRNVAIIMEAEPAYIGAENDPNTGRALGDQNRNPRTQAQFLGNLAPNEKSGDDNRRLGFEVHGFIALDNPHDVDVYSFTADGGTEVWFDIDRTSYGLNVMIELVDANGQMVARSTDNDTLTSTAFATAETFNKDPHLGRDFYGTNPNDAAFRVVLPGTQKGATYFVRVRSEGTDLNNINTGLTRGEYRLQVRVRQVDNKPGSTVRYADIRYATNGIEVIGLPYHSPLLGESAESTTPNDTFAQAQYLGNLLTSDRGTISVSGSLSSAGDIDWFSFDLDYDFLQVIGGVSDAAKTISAIFDIDYADGLSRPDTTISVFNSAGQLIFIGRDSDIEDDQPGAGEGLDTDDLARGSFGKLDPYIGSVQMPAGSVGAGETRRYYVAISSNRRLPTVLNAQFIAGADNPLVRLEPVNSVRRIVEDHIGYTDGSNLAQGAGSPLFDVSNALTLAAHVATFELSDVALFITPGLGLNQVNPYTGNVEVGNYGGTDQIRDITMRNDGRLFGYRSLIGDVNNAGQLVEFNYDTNTWVVRGNDGIANIPNPVPNPLDPDLLTTDRVDALAFRGNSFDEYHLYFSVAGATDTNGNQVSRLYRANPETGNVRDGTGPLGAKGNIVPNTTLTATGTASFVDPVNGFISSITFDAATPGAPGNAIQFQFTKSNRGFGAAPGVTVAGTTISVDLNTVAANASANYGTAAGITFDAVPTGAAGNGIVVNITKATNVPGGVSATRVGRTINVTMDDTNATAAQLKSVVDSVGAGLVTVNFSGSPTTVIGATGPAGSFTLTGGGPSSLQDAINAINASAEATALVTIRTTNGNLLADITPGVPDGGPMTVQLAGGTGTVSRTTGLAFLGNTLYGVSETGAFYTINVNNGSANTIRQFEPGVRFTGLTLGPQNLYGGAYRNFFFALTESGQIIVFDANGVEQPILAGGASRVNSMSGTGLAFSLNDFNLWHTTRFRGSEAGHGVNAAPDNSRGATEGGASFYFGIEQWNDVNTTYHYHGSGTQQLGINAPNFQRNLTSNPQIGNNYNFPGGAKGSLTTDSFSLEGYSPTDKPTFYFNYWLDTEGRQSVNNGAMRDAARVWISRDNGLTWELIATNNSQLDNPGTVDIDGELPPFKSTSGSELPANPRQHIQELYDSASWRQARIDLSDYAGEANLKFRFEFSTSGATDLGTIEGQFGDNSSPERGQRNNFGGFMIDDLIVGFAERGEMVTGATPGLTTFFVPPPPVAPGGIPTPNEVLQGSYQLEIRRGADYGVNADGASANILLYETWDTNARLIRDTREAPPPAVIDFQSGTFGPGFGQRGDEPWTILEDPLAPGEFRAYSSNTLGDAQSSGLELTMSIGAGTITFDWGVSSANGDVLAFFIDGAIQSVITGDIPTHTVSFDVTNGTHTFRWEYIKNNSGTAGEDRGWLDNIAFSNGPSLGVGTRGDENHWRDQGHIQIENNLITDSLLVGILVDAADRSIAGVNLPFQGSVRKLTVPNTDDLAPGVALVNNTIGGYGTAGIRFSGDPNVAGQPVAASPFGRIINNTIYGGPTARGVGIQVDENAAPTILNNIIANAVTGIGIDGSSAPTTVVGFNLFQGNTNNGTIGSDAILLAPNEPLFVSPSTRNFYLAANSRAIDSAINSLVERPSYHAVIAELGIPDSPILAPDLDMYGQKRLDDPGVTNPTPGQGGAIVKDRGAIERADFTGARVALIVPEDNDLNGQDRDPALNDVIIKPRVSSFQLQLIDTGIGIDDLAVRSTQFTILKNGVVVPRAEYSFSYNTNTDVVTFIHGSGVWEEGYTYTIIVDNSAATGVKDLAGNVIQPNRQDGSTQFNISVGIPWDYSDAPGYEPARHDLSTSLILGTIVSADLGPKLPDADDDDGLVAATLIPGMPSSITYVSSGVGVLDLWIDLNGDGDFLDPNEKIGSFATVAGTNTQTFTLPAGERLDTYMRLRLTSAGIASPIADADDGEVEDYFVSLSGPPFQNPNRGLGEAANDPARRDVNGDGFVTAIDALIIINHLQRLNAYNAANDPDLSAELPIPGIIETVGTIPNARYVDVNGDGFMAADDAVTVINWLRRNPITPSDGEGEGEGALESVVVASLGDSSAAASDPMYASSSIVIEERIVEIDASEVAADLLASDEFQPVGSDQGWNADELFGALGGSDEDEEEDLISILAFNVNDGDDSLS